SYLCSSDDRQAVPLAGLSKLLERSTAHNLIVWLDCCHSGELLDFAHVFQNRNGLFLASSLPSEESYELGGHGILSKALLEGLNPERDPGGVMNSFKLLGFLENKLKGQIQSFHFGLPLNDSIELTRMPAARSASPETAPSGRVLPSKAFLPDIKLLQKKYAEQICTDFEDRHISPFPNNWQEGIPLLFDFA
ncbi:MAG: hypothetical protein GY862_14285, partial [Gammaproteobacteria bacterium]|nr:hypothetical protein [Gammaproteobacteria bacterium]